MKYESDVKELKLVCNANRIAGLLCKWDGMGSTSLLDGTGIRREPEAGMTENNARKIITILERGFHTNNFDLFNLEDVFSTEDVSSL